MATDEPQPVSRDLPLREAQKPTDAESFDIAATYNSIIEDPDLTKPVAAIEALIALLGATRSTTVFETIELVKEHSDRLKAAVANPIPLLAGIDLFQHNLTSWFKNQHDIDAAGGSSRSRRPPSQYPSFEHVREHLLRNTRQFALHALEARDSVAEHGWRFVRENKTVLTHGASRAVIGILERAASELSKKHLPKGDEAAGQKDVRFKVVYVRDESRAAESDRVAAELRGFGIPVAEISISAVAHVLETPRAVDLILLGAEAVTHDGGIISRIGTLQIAKLADTIPKRDVLVAAETHKFVRLLPLNAARIGCRQSVLDYTTQGKGRSDDLVDYTPGKLIKELITENGVKQPGYVAKYLFDLYGTLAIFNPDSI